MKQHTASDSLLEWLSKEMGCMYLSDLHKPELFPAIQKVLDKLDPEKYSLQEWKDAVHYLTGENCSFTTQKQFALFLQNYDTKS